MKIVRWKKEKQLEEPKRIKVSVPETEKRRRVSKKTD